jgi:hypothetical protein
VRVKSDETKRQVENPRITEIALFTWPTFSKLVPEVKQLKLNEELGFWIATKWKQRNPRNQEEQLQIKFRKTIAFTRAQAIGFNLLRSSSKKTQIPHILKQRGRERERERERERQRKRSDLEQGNRRA